MSDYAINLIQEAYEKRSKFLDLGNCGLLEVPPQIVMLSDLLEELNLSSSYGNWNTVHSNNRFKTNHFSSGGQLEILSNLVNLKALHVGSCGLRDLEAIAEIRSLTHLDISDNALSAANFLSLRKLQNLTWLNISGHGSGDEIIENLVSHLDLLKFQAFNSEITDAGAQLITEWKNLNYLDIGFNQVADIGTQHISKLDKLETLLLWRNIFTSKGIELFANMSALMYLNVDSNSIDESGIHHICQLPSLTRLTAIQNKIGHRGAKAIANLSNLESLGISSNNIGSEGISNLTNLSNLSALFVSRNEIGDLGVKYISSLPNLTTLSIDYNNIGNEGAKSISNIDKLSKLYISGNNIDKSGIKSLSKLQHLTTLYLNNCRLKDTDMYEIGMMANLKELSVNQNGIGDEATFFIKNLSGLTYLSVTHNRIGSTGCGNLSKLANLISLDAASNDINDDGIYKLALLRNLINLDLRDNQVQNIPFDLVINLPLDIDISTENYHNKNKILLAGNPLENPPQEVLQQGRNAILEYLQADLRPLNECKLIFVGHGSVGKTSLMKRLVDRDFDPQEKPTHGINKIAWEGLKNQNNETIKINLWDFGGQHMQHSLHQFFFTERVIYVLVLNPRNDEKANYWVDQIEKLGPESQCIVVYNWKQKEDKDQNYLSNFHELRKTYPRLQDPILLSCASGDGMNEFKEAIRKNILANDWLKRKYPVKWFEIKATLEKQIPVRKNYIEYSQYEKLCEERQYNDPERRKNLLRILNTIGSIVFFDIPVVDQLQILNPEWITTGAYAILTSKKTTDAKGHLKWDDLKEIFATEKEIFSDPNIKIKYTEPQFNFILQLMLEYRLCQKNPFKDHEYLVPSAFGQPPRRYETEKLNTRHYRFQFNSAFEMLIIHRFIAKNIRQIVSNDYWNSGIYFKHSTSNTYALVDTNLYSKQIDCWIKGENIRGLWEVIRSDFTEIFGIYYNFPVKEEVLYESGNRPVFLPYHEMLNALKNGFSVIPYHPTYQLTDIDVLKVLGLFESPEQTDVRIGF